MKKGIKSGLEIIQHDRDRDTVNDPKRVIYTSSYDRGLEHLLKIWGDVIKEVPDAELHIFYGWDLFVRFYKDNPERMAWKAKMDKMMEQTGITDHGRVSQPEILKEMEKCGIWAYPCHFGEISCISGMKSQISGCVPVVMNYAALETTVQHGIKVDGDIFDPETREAFKNELVSLLKDPKRQEEIRKPMVKWAREHFAWSKIAKGWSEEFKR